MLGQVQSDHRQRLPAALLAYALSLAVFLLLPPLFLTSVGPPAGFTLQEAIDLVTPLVVVPLAWYVFDLSGGLGRAGLAAFLAAALWVEGQGIHLAANAIGDAFPSPAAADVFYETTPGELSHWLDEVLSHWLWHLAWAAISVLVLASATLGRTTAESGSRMIPGLAGFLHGATFWMVTTEGVTTMIGIPVSLLLLAWGLAAMLTGRSRTPIVTFFVVSSLTTLLAYLGWAAMNNWTLPEPCSIWTFC